MTDDRARPTSPASAPPAMVLSAENREFIKNLVQEIWLHGLSVETSEALIEKFAQDMWNAALAAQPPEPREKMNCARYMRLGHCPPNDLCSYHVAESVPPQPGDAETEYGAELMRQWADALEANPEMSVYEIALVSGDDLPGDLRKLAASYDAVQSERDAAQSALAESRAENERLQKALAVSNELVAVAARAVVAARLRSPVAVGEDRTKEQLHRLFYDAFHAWFMSEDNGCDFWSECDAPEALATVAVELADRESAAARSQGVREERERWLDCAQVDATMEGPKLRGWNRSALDRFWRAALAAPEPQNPQTAKRPES